MKTDVIISVQGADVEDLLFNEELDIKLFLYYRFQRMKASKKEIDDNVQHRKYINFGIMSASAFVSMRDIKIVALTLLNFYLHC